MIESRAPGKLYIAGEYAVVEEGYPAILFSVDRFIRVSLEKAEDLGSICTYDRQPIAWKREEEGSRLVLDKRDNRLAYLMASIKIVETYAKELGIDLDFYHLRVDSDLEADNGKKYGLGSSAAVTVATVDVLCKYYGIEIDRMDLFKLSALAQLSINATGSCGDIASSAFGGIISYRAFDKDWVRSRRRELTIGELLDEEWKSLEIEELTIPKDLKILIGWTGEPASTGVLVDSLEDKRVDKDQAYDDFLRESSSLVEDMIGAFKREDIDSIELNIDRNRQALLKLSRALSMTIETEKLTRLIDIASQHGGRGKSSGAGGGDCGIAIFRSGDRIDQVVEDWSRAGIVHLDLNIYER